MATTRYDCDLDHNGQWRWIAIANNDEIVVSPEGYVHLQDCLHAIALMQDIGRLGGRGGVEEAPEPNSPEGVLAQVQSRLQ